VAVSTTSSEVTIKMLMMMISITISMGLDYVSELLPPTGLLFIFQVIYGNGEPWWIDSDMG
jgi:hypothetical protein